MIPKKIHYCWFGHNPKPKLIIKCIQSWVIFCKGYEIIEWNEENFDIGQAPKYVREAYKEKKWAFVTDYVRLKVIYEEGGIYFDTDLELTKSIDDLLVNRAFFCSENGAVISTGLGFGAEPRMECVRRMMEDYDHATFVYKWEDGNKALLDMTTCPVRNTKALSYLIGDTPNFNIAYSQDGILFLPRDWFCPLDYSTLLPKYRTANTRGIHWFAGSWYSKDQIEKRKHDWIKQMPIRFVIRVIGFKKYGILKQYINIFLRSLKA